MVWLDQDLNDLAVCAMGTSIGTPPLTGLAIFVTIVFTSAGSGPDGISAISKSSLDLNN
jgi:hypothetical protein